MYIVTFTTLDYYKKNISYMKLFVHVVQSNCSTVSIYHIWYVDDIANDNNGIDIKIHTEP